MGITGMLHASMQPCVQYAWIFLAQMDNKGILELFLILDLVYSP